MTRAKGKELIFLKRIDNDGTCLKPVDDEWVNDVYNQEDVYEINCLSMTYRTYIASGNSTYIVRFKNLFGVKAEELRIGQQVYHKDIYNARELLKVIGISEDSVHLQGDFSGGTNNIIQSDWLSLDGVRTRPPHMFMD
jgi:hypothetical protein